MAAPANDSLRLALIKSMSAYLSDEINPDNGYKNDLKNKVMRGVAVHSAVQLRLPCISIFEGVNSRTAEEGVERDKVGGDNDPVVAYWQQYMISGWTHPADKNAPTDECYELMADVKKALGKVTSDLEEDGKAFDGLINEIDVDPGIVLPREDSAASPQFVLRIKVRIVEAIADPYRIDD